MKRMRFAFCVVLAIFLLLTGPAGRTAPVAGMAKGSGGSLESISGSYMYHNNVVSPNHCFTRGSTQWFCFQAISYTNDNDYVYYLWMRFPSDWVVGDAMLYDVPYCTSGGTFTSFSWFAPTVNEVRIQHVRYQAVNDACSAYYCVLAAPVGSPSSGLAAAEVSWYWQSSAYGSPPFYPCSSDGYTPAGQPACDEMITPVAILDQCMYNVYLPRVVNH